MTNEIFLSPDQVSARYPGLTPRWLARQRWERGQLPYVKAGKRVLYRQSDVERYLEANTVLPGSQLA